MRYDRMSRRHFLQGLGGTWLALPLLPSLLSKAEAATLVAPRFLVVHWTYHGSLLQEYMNPVPGMLGGKYTTATMPDSGKYQVKTAALKSIKVAHGGMGAKNGQSGVLQYIKDFDNGAARVSPVIGSFTEDALLDKMSVLQGINASFYTSHWEGILGNFTARDPAVAPLAGAGPALPSIDYVLSASNKFYSAADRAILRAPSLMLGPGSFNLSHYKNAQGSIVANSNRIYKAGDLWDRIFKGVASTSGSGTVDPKVDLVQRVYDEYSRLSKGAYGAGKRLGNTDRLRLDEYMGNLADIKTKLKASSTATGPACSAFRTLSSTERNTEVGWGEWPQTWPSGGGVNDMAAYNKASMALFNDILVAAMMCGYTRMAIQTMSTLKDNWVATADPATGRTDAHETMFHHLDKQAYAEKAVEAQRYNFQYGYLDLARKMNAAQYMPGASLLDLAMVIYTNEEGPAPHTGNQLPMIVAGGAGGAVNTGKWIDYRNMGVSKNQYGWTYYSGQPLNRMLGTVLQSMGLSPSDYEVSDSAFSVKFPANGNKVPGYGDPVNFPNNADVCFDTTCLADMGKPLPFYWKA